MRLQFVVNPYPDMPTVPLAEARDALQRWGDELAGILRSDARVASGVE